MSDAGAQDEGQETLASIAAGGSSPTTGGREREGERERSESSLAFERVLSGPRDDTGGNVFAMTDALREIHRDAETPNQLHMSWSRETPGSLYDESGFLRGSPAREVRVFR